MSLGLPVWNQSGLIIDQSRALIALSLFMSPEIRGEKVPREVLLVKERFDFFL
jgi:hypothetical protein